MVAAQVKRLQPGDPDRIGSYRLVGRIGAGGMGVVYAGRRPDGPQDLVAVKVIKPRGEGDRHGSSRADRLRFAQEAVLIQRVDAACTPTIFEIHPYGSRPWMAMEYVAGQNLHQHVRTRGPLRGEQLFYFGLGTAEALTAIHGADVVHLDLHPGNIILGDSGPRVLDFGLARALDIDPLHSDRGLFGTPGYISPERADGHHGPPADVFAWGAVVAFAATGANPFGTAPGADSRRTKARLLLERARRGGADLSLVPESVREIVERALDPRPERRPEAAELYRFFADHSDETGTVETGAGSVRDFTSQLLDQKWRVTGTGGAARSRREPARRGGRGATVRPGRKRRDDAGALVFAHRSFTDPGRLAAAMADRHAEAERWLRDGGAERLRTWLAGREGAGSVVDELETAGSAGTAAQRAITVFASVFCPTATPRYRGVAVDAAGLAGLARRGPRGADRALLAEVFERGVVAALGRCGHTRLRLLPAKVPKLTEAAVGRLVRAGRAVDQEHRRRAFELAVLSLLGEEPRWSRPAWGTVDGQWRRLRADARRDTGDGGRTAALIALALYPSTVRRTRPRRTAVLRHARALFAPPRRLWATLRSRALLALLAYPVWQALALSAGMLTRTFGEPYRYATAAQVGREFGAAAAERAADLSMVLAAVALGLLVLRVAALRWVSVVGALAAVLLALPQVAFPGLWAPAGLRFLLHETATVWGSMVAWGGLLGCGGAAVGVLRLWRALPRGTEET